MLEHLTHDALTLIVSGEKPIRGRARKEYPYGNRNQALYKDFFQNKDESYTIRYYGEEILKIHKGNILEVVKNYFGQGTKTVLNEFHKGRAYTVNGTVYAHREIRNSKIHGGLIYEFYKVNKVTERGIPIRGFAKNKYAHIILPLRVGMRFNMLTDTVVKGYEYDVMARKLNRKKSIKLLEEKESLFLRNKVIMNTIPPINIIKDIKEAIKKVEDFEFIGDLCDESYKQDDIYNLVTNLIAKEENLVNYHGLKWGSAEQLTTGYNPIGADDILKWSTDCLKEYLKEKHNLYDVTKKQPCEDRYFTSNKRIKFIMRGNNNEV